MIYAAAGIAILLVMAPLHGARAQDLDPALCDQLAGMPNAPMTVESCKEMMGMAAGLEAAANDPRARRPGDEAMSCNQIFAELKTMAGVGISEANTAQLDTVVRDGGAAVARGAADTTAFMAETTAIGIAMAAMGPYVPNFVGAAIVAAWQARAVAFGARQQAEQAKLTAQMRPAFSAATADLAKSMQANPRFARLGQLAIRKACEAPATEPR